MNRWIVALMAGTAMLPAAAYAQDAARAGAGEGAESQSGDIIVTAQRYKQRLQDVPLSVSAVSGDELASRGATDLKDLQYSVPGFSMYETGVGRSTVQLRGISTTIGSSTVGVYFDETPLSLDASTEGFNVRLLDLERVEVLRGPQATLYGQGSMGGTIRYIPAAPRLDDVSGSFDGEYSTTRYGASNYKAVGVLNLPLTTGVAGIRLVAGYERVGGFIDNVTTGENNINSADIYTVRGSFLLQPTDRFSLSLLGLYQKTDQANQDSGTHRQTNSILPSPLRDRYTLVQGKIGYDLDFAELSTSASWIDRRNVTQFDLSDAFVPVLVDGFGFPAGFIDRIGIVATTDYEIFNSEIRLASQSEGPFGWQVGASYNSLNIHQYGGTFTAPGTLPFAIIASDDVRKNKAFTLYGEANYAFTPQLRAIVGVRYYRERKRRDVLSTNFGLTSPDTGDATFETVNPRVNLSYEFTPDSMVYANVAKGFRSGGFNQTSAGGGIIDVPLTYDPDKIWTYELGTKHQLFGNKLILDASVYRSEWSDVQSNNFAPGGVVTIINNSGHVSGWGVDLSATMRPVRDLTLTATYGWNNLKFDEASADKAVGDPVDAAVRNSWSASFDYRPQLSDSVTGIFRIDYQHAGKGQFTLRNQPVQVIERPKRDLVNLRVGVGVGPVEVALFANNLFDEDAPVIIGPFSLFPDDIEQRPRVIGISASGRF
ncbi:outer membrane receptor protein involved in Fe transport [Sphingopyxis panaciterrae]|uniref:TonB-dependent receptor n=1 Tax=Sphingopyxis panaciterrae TaxID=363841 RepID=UPI00141E9FAC|nr:TonB-dependent receptor [Sphingopyxis panaciterrae]NIJ35866.1 outer membrane receptor protein involved in Fe transport [Sphingopyxis panaciterrae]